MNLGDAEAAVIRSVDAAQHRVARASLDESDAVALRSSNTQQRTTASASRATAMRQRRTGIARRIDNRPRSAHHLGEMNDVCCGCGSRHFESEKTETGNRPYSIRYAFENFPAYLRGLEKFSAKYPQLR